MKALSRISFPAIVTAIAVAGSLDLSRGPVESSFTVAPAQAQDTVVYPHDGWKLRRTISLEEITIVDSLSGSVSLEETADSTAAADTLPHLSPRDSLKALLDSTMWDKIDSIWIADSSAKAKAEFERWYNSLSRSEQKAYDSEQKALAKIARADSIGKWKEQQKEIRDSIIQNTPRILETYVLPDSLLYKRLVTWNLDPDFGEAEPFTYDTTYNYRYKDYPFRKNDVNATWLGMSGSPVQYYNWFKRSSDEGVEFYDAFESWSFSPRTLPHFNTKTPYTELSYTGTLFAKDAKESDNLHIFTSQNILPELNFSLLFDRYGGEGMLMNEKTVNKTAVAQANYIGKRYSMHVGYISNKISQGENGGIVDNYWIRDTTVDSRDVRVALQNASSKVKKKTAFLEQQLRIPFTFLERMKSRRDSNYVFNADSLNRDITTAFIGHSSEFSTYTRKYTDNTNDSFSKDYYHDRWFYSPDASADSMRVMKLDNKLYIRLQPWSDEGVVSKLDLGIGDYLKHYLDSTTLRPLKHTENSAYVYAGARGQIRNNVFWNAKASYVFAGYDFGNMDIEAEARLDVYPFRRARKSPASLSARFETSLTRPTFYQQRLNTNHFRWDNNFSRISETRLEGRLEIPRWNLDASVGYALLDNNIYYDSEGMVRQNEEAMSVLSAYLRKEFALGPLHLDNRALVQFSSKPEVVPVPTAAFNLRAFLQFVVQRDESKTRNIMTMQIGADAWYNTRWHSPAWNPNVGVFYNQNVEMYNNGPWFDLFVNVQWKRACIFIKYQNAGMGWPMQKNDYFSADRHIVTVNGFDGFKIGIWWPFYTQPQ